MLERLLVGAQGQIAVDARLDVTKMSGRQRLRRDCLEIENVDRMVRRFDRLSTKAPRRQQSVGPSKASERTEQWARSKKLNESAPVFQSVAHEAFSRLAGRRV